MKSSLFITVALLAHSFVSSVGAQELSQLPEPIAPSQSLPVLPEPIGATAPANSALKGIRNRVADEHEAIKASAELVLPRLLSRELTVQEAWDKKFLAAPHIEYLLGEYLHEWGGFGWTMDVELRRALAKRLVKHWEQSTPEKLQTANLPKIKPQVRLWVADYLQSTQDGRSVAVAESIVSEIKLPVSGGNDEALVLQALERIAWYYDHLGDYKKSAEAWVRTTKAHQDTGWWTIHAAWALEKSGEEKQEWEIWTPSLRSSDKAEYEMGVVQQAMIHVRKKRFDAAREHLKQLEKVGALNIDKVKQLSWIAQTYKAEGNIKMAYECLDKAVTTYVNERLSSDQKGLPYNLKRDQEYLKILSQVLGVSP